MAQWNFVDVSTIIAGSSKYAKGNGSFFIWLKSFIVGYDGWHEWSQYLCFITFSFHILIYVNVMIYFFHLYLSNCI